MGRSTCREPVGKSRAHGRPCSKRDTQHVPPTTVAQSPASSLFLESTINAGHDLVHLSFFFLITRFVLYSLCPSSYTLSTYILLEYSHRQTERQSQKRHSEPGELLSHSPSLQPTESGDFGRRPISPAQCLVCMCVGECMIRSEPRFVWGGGRQREPQERVEGRVGPAHLAGDLTEPARLGRGGLRNRRMRQASRPSRGGGRGAAVCSAKGETPRAARGGKDRILEKGGFRRMHACGSARRQAS